MIQQDYVYNGQIINVVDGDTCDIKIDLGFYVYIHERMRLNGIDTAELNSTDPGLRKLAQDAKAWLAAYSGRSITLKSYKKDKFGRFLVDIFLPGETESLNSKLLSLGLAKPYDGGARV